ncbi:DUF2267 domain-containing protein [Streptomyces sp. NBC_00038]|uniref:DUF2267 domain-containing protein n=1 Tax=Streptomyces sp. NBC_00038 TaxID=2903615 RepID=UPI00225000A8|nr:DUF2267 domain-containing protein [Streptomyces sp. NBC_00038]MCX5558010.1 DUF2267 domain-containing protein [Streptomyces sp. NBC_00038]
MVPPTASTDTPSPRRMTWDELIDAVRESGQYPTRAEAERITRTVLSGLGGHVVGDERAALARRLPTEASELIASQIPVTRHLTAVEFVDAIASRIQGATPATARWDVSSVLSVLPRAVGDDLVDCILKQLPSGYALLFGRAELAPGRGLTPYTSAGRPARHGDRVSDGRRAGA